MLYVHFAALQLSWNKLPISFSLPSGIYRFRVFLNSKFIFYLSIPFS